MTCGIYSITNTKNGKRYIGSAVNIEKRWRDHRRELRAGKHRSGHLQRAWNRYGESFFRFEVLTTCEPEQLIEQEQFWIDAFQTAREKHGYNLSPTAGNTLGVKHTAEARANMSAAHLGNTHGPEARAKIAAAGRKRIFSAETREKIGAAHRGKKASEELRARMSAITRDVMKRPEVRAKISAASRARKASPETRAKMSAAMTGKKYSAEVRAKVSAGLRGRKVSEETRAKISEGTRAAWARPEIRETMFISALQRSTTKLNEEKVRSIRRLLAEGMSERSIAKKFGVSRGSISDIRSGRTWGMVK